MLKRLGAACWSLISAGPLLNNFDGMFETSIVFMQEHDLVNLQLGNTNKRVRWEQKEFINFFSFAL